MTTYIQFVKGIHGHKSVWLKTRDKEGKERIDSQRIVGNKPWAGGITQEELPVDLERFLNNIQCYIKANPSLVSRPTLFEKAEAYDRMMSGGEKSLKEWANIFGMNVAVEPDYWTEDKLRCVASDRKLYLKESETIYGKVFLWANEVRGHQYEIPFHLVDYSGDWKNSLTLPDGWEAK